MRDKGIQTPEIKGETSCLEESVKALKSTRFIEEFERFYTNVLQCKNMKKIKIKWIR